MIQDKSPASRIFDVLIYLFMAAVIVVALYPILNIFATSLSSSVAVERGLVTFYPREFTLRAYEMIFENAIIPRSFLNSILYTVMFTAVALVLTILLSYPLSKKRLPMRKFYTVIIVVTMFISGGLVPTFLLVTKLGFYDSMLALVIPGAISTSNVMVMTSFFRSLPEELEESAMLDGANDVVILIRIMLPLATASIATIGLFYAVYRWNDWFTAMIYLKSTNKFPLPLILRELVIENKLEDMMNIGGNAANINGGKNLNAMRDNNMRNINAETLKYATLMVSIIPMMIVYPFVQKFFVKGVMIGSLKG